MLCQYRMYVLYDYIREPASPDLRIVSSGALPPIGRISYPFT